MKAAAEKLKNLKIKSKLLIVYFLMMGLTISIIYFVSAARINSVLLAQASGDLNSSTLQIRENITSLLNSYEKATDYIVFNQMFIANISHPADTRPEEYDRTKQAGEILGFLKNIDPTISAIRVYMFEDTVLFDGKTFIRASGDAGEPVDLKAGISWTGRRVNNKNVSTVRLNRLIFNYPQTSKKIGILSVEIPESRFYEYIQKESLNKSVIIFNGEGEIVTASGGPLLDTVENELKARAGGGPQGQFEFKAGGEDYTLFYTSTSRGWRIASYIPITSLLSTTIGINRYVAAVILLSVAAFMAATTVLLNILTNRISQFAKAVHRVGEGQYNFRLSIDGKDEVGQLADDFNKMIGKLDVLFNDVYVAQIRQKEAELQALQAQINPHFLYNVLSSIGFAALKKNAPEIRNMLNDLAEFYRFSLSKGNSLVTLEEEIAQVKTYMSLQNMRFGSMVSISYNIPKDLLGVRILKLTLQPFVENAINHAIRDSETQLSIRVSATGEGGGVRIGVHDDGAGIPEAKLAEIRRKIDSGVEGKSYGIQNVHNRIRFCFGEAYGVSIESVPGKGTDVFISLPAS